MQDSDRYEPDYAMSLSNYAIWLSEAGQNKEALEHAREGLEIRRRLADGMDQAPTLSKTTTSKPPAKTSCLAVAILRLSGLRPSTS